MSTLYPLTFIKDYRPNQGAAYNCNEGAVFPLTIAIQLVGQGIAVFTNPTDLTNNQAAVTAATPTSLGLVAVDTFIRTTNDGSEPTVVVRQRN